MNYYNIANNFLANYAGPEIFHVLMLDLDDSIINAQHFMNVAQANHLIETWYLNNWIRPDEIVGIQVNGHSFAFYYI